MANLDSPADVLPHLTLPPAPDSLDVTMPWTPDDDLRREMARLEADYAAAPDPLAVAGQPASGYAASTYSQTPLPGALTTGGPDDPVRLRAENEELHKLLEEMRQIFEHAARQEEANVRAQEDLRGRIVDLERAGHEKDERVTLLTSQIAELEHHIQEAPAVAPPPPPPNEDELAKLSDELEKERCMLAQDRRTIDQERHQLREDEEALMKQMREMEVQMAKERAELARQRTDLQRLHAEVRQELEQLQRGDGALRDRLAQFQRRHQAVFDRGGPAAAAEPPPAAAESPPAAAAVNGRGDSGLIRRFFGRS